VHVRSRPGLTHQQDEPTATDTWSALADDLLVGIPDLHVTVDALDEGWMWCYADNAFFDSRMLERQRARLAGT
jgi:hypothetical protein